MKESDIMLGRKKKKLPRKFIVIGSLSFVVILLIIFSITLKDDRKLNPVESFFKDTLIYIMNLLV